MFEIINGLALRSDATSSNGSSINNSSHDGNNNNNNINMSRNIFSIPLAPIPGGTGNGLVKSLLSQGNEDYSVTNATYMAVKGGNQPLDLSIVQTKNNTYYSFLLLGWGLISDIDLLSEHLRFLGELRLYLAAIYFIAKKKYYKGRVSLYTGSGDGDGRGSSENSGCSSSSNGNNGRMDSKKYLTSLPSFDTQIQRGGN